jgi:predicted RNA-binding protein
MANNYWLLVTHPDNFKVMKQKNIAAMKAKRKSFADRVEVGDKVVFYLTKIGKFGGVAEFKSKVREDTSKIFTEEKPGETHPWRFDVEFEVALDEDKYVGAENFKDKLKYLKKWPAKYWKLGFQGNVHEIPKEDYETLKKGIVNRS